MAEGEDYDVGEERRVKKRRARANVVRGHELSELRDILSSRHGRAFFWRALSQCGVYLTNFQETPTTLAFHEGRRSIGLWLLDEILTARPEAYSEMRTEATAKEVNDVLLEEQPGLDKGEQV